MEIYAKVLYGANNNEVRNIYEPGSGYLWSDYGLTMDRLLECSDNPRAQTSPGVDTHSERHGNVVCTNENMKSMKLSQGARDD